MIAMRRCGCWNNLPMKGFAGYLKAQCMLKGIPVQSLAYDCDQGCHDGAHGRETALRMQSMGTCAGAEAGTGEAALPCLPGLGRSACVIVGATSHRLNRRSMPTTAAMLPSLSLPLGPTRVSRRRSTSLRFLPFITQGFAPCTGRLGCPPPCTERKQDTFKDVQCCLVSLDIRNITFVYTHASPLQANDPGASRQVHMVFGNIKYRDCHLELPLNVAGVANPLPKALARRHRECVSRAGVRPCSRVLLR